MFCCPNYMNGQLRDCSSVRPLIINKLRVTFLEAKAKCTKSA
jgi:hypothetical protein